MIAYTVAVLLLGFLLGGAFGYYSAERDRAKRERDALLWRRVAGRDR